MRPSADLLWRVRKERREEPLEPRELAQSNRRHASALRRVTSSRRAAVPPSCGSLLSSCGLGLTGIQPDGDEQDRRNLSVHGRPSLSTSSASPNHPRATGSAIPGRLQSPVRGARYYRDAGASTGSRPGGKLRSTSPHQDPQRLNSRISLSHGQQSAAAIVGARAE